MTIELQKNFRCTERAMVHNRISQNNSRVIVFLGGPGSGKGTQSAWLAGQLGVPGLSTGDLLREAARSQTPEGECLKETLAAGSLVSDEMVCKAVGSQLQRAAVEGGLILDGFPRTVAQAEYLDAALSKAGLPCPLVLHLDVSRQQLLRRLTARRQCATCGAIFNLHSRPSKAGELCEYDGGPLFQREDDNDNAISRRLMAFEASLASLVRYYRIANYYRLDGDRPPSAISAEVLRLAGRFATSVAA